MGIYSVPLPAGYFSVFSSCLYFCVCGGLFEPLSGGGILAVCGSSLLSRFLTVGGVGRVAYEGFLVREACVGVLVGGAGFLLSGVH